MRARVALNMKGAWTLASAVFLVSWFAYAPTQWLWLQMSYQAGLSSPLFPGVLSDSIWGLALYAAPALGLFCFWRLDRVRALIASILWLGSSVLSAYHLDFYDAASATVLMWCAAILMWMAWHLDDESEKSARQLRLLVRALVAMVFSAGAIGKLTPGYLNGEIFLDQPITTSTTYFFRGMRALFEGDALVVAAAWYSRFVILAELGAALSAFLSLRVMACVVSAMVLGMLATIGLSLANVVVGIGGLVLAVALMREPGGSLRDDLQGARPGVLLTAMVLTLLLSWSWPLWSWPREQVMRHHQGDPANALSWVVWQWAPKMYGFEHRIEHRVLAGAPQDELERCMTKSRANHMPMAVLTSAYCRSDFDPGVVVEQRLQSRYFGSCRESRWELSYQAPAQLRARVVRQRLASGPCEP